MDITRHDKGRTPSPLVWACRRLRDDGHPYFHLRGWIRPFRLIFASAAAMAAFKSVKAFSQELPSLSPVALCFTNKTSGKSDDDCPKAGHHNKNHKLNKINFFIMLSLNALSNTQTYPLYLPTAQTHPSSRVRRLQVPQRWTFFVKHPSFSSSSA